MHCFTCRAGHYDQEIPVPASCPRDIAIIHFTHPYAQFIVTILTENTLLCVKMAELPGVKLVREDNEPD